MTTCTRAATALATVSGSCLAGEIIHGLHSVHHQKLWWLLGMRHPHRKLAVTLHTDILTMHVCRRALPLETGSALVLDNYNVMHGRLPYEGGNRTMVTVLTSN